MVTTTTTSCDHCGRSVAGREFLTLDQQRHARYLGSMDAQSQWHFCFWQCLLGWLEARAAKYGWDRHG